MGRLRRPTAVVPWVRSTEGPLPESYRMNLIIRDPALIALLVRGVPHGQITKSLQRLLREGYDRLVATGHIDPSHHLTHAEQVALQSGIRKAARAQGPAHGPAPDDAIPETLGSAAPARLPSRASIPAFASPITSPPSAQGPGLPTPAVPPDSTARSGGGFAHTAARSVAPPVLQPSARHDTGEPHIADDDADVLLNAQN